MITKILKLQNIGLLKDATQNRAVSLARVTAIFADNGRGKSTLTAVLRACQLGDAGRINARTTIDTADSPEVKLLLPTGSHVEFTSNAWTATLPDIVVFDSEFVEQNVYSGFEVRPDQRQSLLEFALGDQPVQLKQKIDKLTEDIESQTRKRTQADRVLAGFASPYSVPEFVALQSVPDAQQQIYALQKRIESAKSVEQLVSRKLPAELDSIQFEVPRVFSILSTQLQDVQEAAEATVKAHLEKHSSKDFEDWLSRGQHLLSDADCPFCGQSIGGVGLIEAYRSYFNDTYAKLKRQVAELESEVASGLADARIETAVSAAATSAARLEVWKDQLSLTIPSLDGAAVGIAIKMARERLLSLVIAKQRAPLEVIGSQADSDSVAAALVSIGHAIDAFNSEIRAQSALIADFKTKLAAENTTVLTADMRKLEAAQKKDLPDVTTAEADYQTADAERRRLNGEKTNARQQLDALMQATLQQYQGKINDLLNTFGADFAIEQLKPTYQGGGEPRSEYGLRLRNKSVRLGSRADIATDRSFATTLSEGDKRTLAFAFFVARLGTDTNLAAKLVVLDDPVASLDRNRRYQSIRQIAGLATTCQQLLVLSHDAYFVRELRDYLASLEPTPVQLCPLRISRVQGNYSAFTECDLDDICASDYYRHHRMVADYVDGKSTATTREVAKAIRPLMEGYYHRRFPGKLPKKAMFGPMIQLAAAAQSPDPLAFLKPILAELGEVNEYAKQFHHDGGDSLPISDPELLQFAKKALSLIYKNG